MEGANQLYRWNAWLDRLEPGIRFDLAVWGFVVLGGVNFLCTLAFGMVFGLLLLLGLVAMNLLRLPYALGELPVPADAAGDPPGAARLLAWRNRLVGASGDVVSVPTLGFALAATFGIGALGLLSSKYGPAFGVLFLLAMLNALVVIRGHVPARATAAAPSPQDKLMEISA